MKLSEVSAAPSAGPMKLSSLKPKDTPAEADARKLASGPDPAGPWARGMTGGLSEDLDAAIFSAVTKARNFGHDLAHEPEPYTSKEADAAAHKMERERRSEDLLEHPVSTRAAEFGGAMLTPGMKSIDSALAAKGMTSGIARSAIMGGGMGGLNAYGEKHGGLIDKLSAIPGGAAAGMVAGAGLQGAANVIPRAGSMLGEAGSRVLHGLQDVFDSGAKDAHQITPEKLVMGRRKGEQYVADLVKKLDPSGAKLKTNPAEAAGKPITAAEALGRPAVTQLKVMGRRMGQTPDKLEAQLHNRAVTAGDRLVTDFHEVTGVDPEAARGNLKNQTEKLREKAAPLYEKFHAHGPLESDELAAIMKTNQFKKALPFALDAISADRENAFEMGLDDGMLPMEQIVHPYTDARGVSVPGSRKFMTDAATGKPMLVPREIALKYAESQGFTHSLAEQEPDRKLSAKGWDYVKQGLDTAIEKHRDGTTGKINRKDASVGSLMKVRRELSDELTNPAMPWGRDAAAAFAAGGDAPRQQEAFESAKNLMSVSVPGHKFDERLKGFTPAQREALKAGVVSEVRDAAMAGKKQLRNMLSDTSIMKLQHIFGKEQAKEIVQRMEMEMAMGKTGARMAPGVGSDTSETMIGNQETREGMYNAVRTVRNLGEGRWKSALLHALSAPTMGMYRGYQAPIDEASRDMVGALLSQSPSELAGALERHGASKAEMAQTMEALEKVGAFAAKTGARARNAVAGKAGAATAEDRP